MITADRVIPTTCPYCGVGCNLELHIKDDYIYKVTSPFDGPVNHGNLCVKGRFGYDFIYSKDRVTTPLIRKTAQTPGARTQAFDRDQWREISWDEALDYTAGRLVEIFKRDGADAMAVYCCAKATNEDNYLLQKLFRALFRTNNIEHCGNPSDYRAANESRGRQPRRKTHRRGSATRGNGQLGHPLVAREAGHRRAAFLRHVTCHRQGTPL